MHETYMTRNTDASTNLHGAAFFSYTPCRILPDMERKPTYIREWRRHRGYTQRDVIGRLEVLGLSMTEASLSRIENGRQPYTQDTLEAIAAALETDPDALIGRNPTKSGTVVDFLARLDEKEAAQAEAVLRAMFTEKQEKA